MLLQTFFPIPPDPVPLALGREPERESQLIGDNQLAIEWPELQEEEARQAIFSSNPKKAPREDSLSFYVWRKL